jgi:hypothetical protein
MLATFAAKTSAAIVSPVPLDYFATLAEIFEKNIDSHHRHLLLRRHEPLD